jgi:iron complex outermembrane receptor protein
MGISKNCFAGAGVAVMLGSLRVFAADTAASSAELETITVTAEKRSETEQSVPLSMTTFSGAALQQKEINTFFDYATKVPNLAFAPTGDGVGTARTVSIRGISGDNVTGFYIDETPLPDSLDPRVLDIDHIEVLRGPQGTLYGARSMGGLVRIVTKAPNLSTFEGSVHGGLSYTARTNQPNWTADGVFNMPIVEDRAALRVSFFGDDQAGYFKRSFCTDPTAAMAVTCTPLATTGISTANNVAALNTYGGAAALTLKVSDALTITPRIMQQRANYNGFPLADYRSMPNNPYGYPVPSPPPTSPVPLPRPLNPSSFTQARWFDVPEGGFDAWALYSIAVNWKTSIGELVSSTAYFTRKVDETED